MYACSLGLGSWKQWWRWCSTGSKPSNVPSNPDKFYKHRGWQGWGHWLGTGNQRNGGVATFLPFNEALPIARSLGLGSMRAWLAWSRSGARPANLPSDPPRTYKHSGWQGWGFWLGSGDHTSTPFAPFEEALAAARSLGLASETEWSAWRKSGARPVNIPADPPVAYRDCGWEGWGHWLGTGNSHGGSRVAKRKPVDGAGPADKRPRGRREPNNTGTLTIQCVR